MPDWIVIDQGPNAPISPQPLWSVLTLLPVWVGGCFLRLAVRQIYRRHVTGECAVGTCHTVAVSELRRRMPKLSRVSAGPGKATTPFGRNNFHLIDLPFSTEINLLLNRGRFSIPSHQTIVVGIG